MDATLSDFDRAMRQRLGERGWLTAPGEIAGQSRDWLDRYGEPPLGVARPDSVDEVADVVRLCAEHGIAVVPQGGNTGLNGASVASDGRSVVVSLARMNRILAIDPVDYTATVEAGVVLAALHEALAEQQLAFPLHLGSEGSARIGGLIGTNAGGSHAMRYGMMQDLVLGLEVVLPDGSVWDGARALVKDNAGYQLRRLFCGAEGTQGPQIKHDISVPVARLADFVAAADAAAQAVLPGLRVNPFGHLGDGNVHFNLSPPEGRANFAARDDALSDAIYAAAVRHGGSIAAEHGLGQAKIALADRFRAATERALMRRLKAALDPHGIMNPGKLV